MPVVLVLDLYEKIATTLRRLSDYKTLLALASTCHTVQALCLKELFHTVSLLPRICDVPGTKGYSSDDDIPTKYLQLRLQDLETLVLHRPRVPTYVRELNIQCHPSTFGDARFLQLLPTFSCLAAVSLSTFYVPSEEIIWGTSPSIKPFRCFAQQWKSLPAPLEAALQQILVLPTIRMVDIQYFQDMPISLFHACREIAALRLLHCSVAEASPEWVAAASSAGCAHSVRIGSLEFGLGPKSISPLLNAKYADGTPLVDTSAIVSLSVHLDSEREELVEFMYGLRGIKHLFIDSRELSYTNVPVLLSRIHPEFLRTLESLKLHLTWRTPMWPQLIITLPTDIYGALTGFTVLSYLELSIVVQTAGQSTELMEDMGRLDELLTSDAQFSTLRRISISIYFDLYKAAMRRNTNIDRRKWQGLRNTHFPRLLAKPSVNLEIIVRV